MENIKRNQYISKVSCQDTDVSLEVVSKPKLEIVEIKDEPSVCIPQTISPPDVSEIPYQYSFEGNMWIPAGSDPYRPKKTKRSRDAEQNREPKREEGQQVEIIGQEITDDVEDNFSKVESDRVIEWIREVQEPSISMIDDGIKLQGPLRTLPSNR